MHTSPTRGFGFLESFLARRRAAMADKQLSDGLRSGTLVDLACGVPPLFLLHARFSRKVGIDFRCADGENAAANIRLLQFDLRSSLPIPIESGSIAAVTMLAIAEHLRPDVLRDVFAEAYRILRPGGVLILTTPAPWTSRLLSLLAFHHVISRLEIDDHECLYSRKELVEMLSIAGFGPANIRTGTFECGMNTWARAGKGNVLNRSETCRTFGT